MLERDMGFNFILWITILTSLSPVVSEIFSQSRFYYKIHRDQRQAYFQKHHEAIPERHWWNEYICGVANNQQTEARFWSDLEHNFSKGPVSAVSAAPLVHRRDLHQNMS